MAAAALPSIVDFDVMSSHATRSERERKPGQISAASFHSSATAETHVKTKDAPSAVRICFIIKPPLSDDRQGVLESANEFNGKARRAPRRGALRPTASGRSSG